MDGHGGQTYLRAMTIWVNGINLRSIKQDCRSMKSWAKWSTDHQTEGFVQDGLKGSKRHVGGFLSKNRVVHPSNDLWTSSHLPYKSDKVQGLFQPFPIDLEHISPLPWNRNVPQVFRSLPPACRLLGLKIPPPWSCWDLKVLKKNRKVKTVQNTEKMGPHRVPLSRKQGKSTNKLSDVCRKFSNPLREVGFSYSPMFVEPKPPTVGWLLVEQPFFRKTWNQFHARYFFKPVNNHYNFPEQHQHCDDFHHHDRRAFMGGMVGDGDDYGLPQGTPTKRCGKPMVSLENDP